MSEAILKVVGDDDVFVDGIRRQLREEVEAAGISYAQAATEIGVSDSTITTFVRDAYPGDNPAIARRVDAWLLTRREAGARSRAAAGVDRHAALGVTEEVQAALAHAQARGDLVLVHGRTGRGKSWAVDHYCGTRNAAWRVQMTATVRTDNAMLSRIAKAVGAGGRFASAALAEEAIVARLQDRRGLLAIDEAHHLPVRLLDELRCIRDIAGCGVALIGGDDLWTRLASTPRCDQIVGRIRVRLALGAPDDLDVRTLAAGALDRQPTEREMRTLTATARGPGGLHALRGLLESAWIIARERGAEAIGAEHLAAAGEAA